VISTLVFPLATIEQTNAAILKVLQ